jgi:hypothetical protein
MPPDELDPVFYSYMPPRRRETPTEGMKRIELEMQDRPNTNPGRIATGAGRTRDGYSASIGAQGPAGGGVMVAADPITGQPVMVGGRAQAGPLSYQYNQPAFRGAPASQQVGVGGQPFDADTYFGVSAQQGPGGRSYGANVSQSGEDGGFSAYGQYNPSRRDVNVGGSYTANFSNGGRALVGHTTAAGVPVSLEEHKGETRHRQDSGNSRMAADYGYIDNSKPDHDGMKTDAFVGPHRDSKKVFVVNQQHPHTGKFNEHKVLLGYKDRAHALRDYAHSFSDGLGHKRIHSVVEMGTHELKDWLKKDHTAPLRKADGGPVDEPAPRPLTIRRGEVPMAPEAQDGVVRDEDTYGPSNIEERRARVQERTEAVNKAIAQYPGDVLEAPQGYITPATAVEWKLGDAGPYAVDAEGNTLPLIKQPGVLPLYRDPTIDSVRVAMPGMLDAAGNVMGAPAGITAARVARAGVMGERPAANIVSAMGAGPTKTIEEVVADLSKMSPEEVAAAREANQGRGLEFPAEEGLDRLRMNLQRAKKAEEKGATLPGAPVNERMVIRGPEGKPDFVIGQLTPEDWVNRAESMMNPNEIKEAADWYKTIRGEFLKYTNGDEAKADQYMRAWLVAQQNVDVAGAMGNVLLQREQLARGVPVEQMRAAGMPNPTEAARAVISGSPIEGGVGQKISDFVDAAEGKSVRSWMANHPEGGSPFVVDVHTARDTGLVDETLLNHLRRLGYNEEDIAKAKIDLQGTPSATQYENRASWGRNELVDHLNEIKWQGKDDWTPAEAQAVGWMGMTRLTADKAEDVVSGIERNVRRISFEIAPGEGSPWASQFGEQFGALPLPEQQRITQVIAEPAMGAASKLSGIDLTNLVHGTGGWNMYQNPAAVGQTLATREGAEIAANTLGYLLQQTEVWSNSVKPMTKNPKSFAVDFVQEGKGGNNYLATNEGLREFWEKVQQNDPSAGSKNPLFVGYQPIKTADGRPGIRVLIDRGGVKTQSALEDAINGPLTKMLEDYPTDISIRGHEAEINKARNDWTGDKDGKGYLARLEQLLGRNPAADLNPVRGQLEEIFKRELQGAKGPARKAQGGSVRGYAEGGEVAPGSFPEQVRNVAHDIARIAHKDKLDQRHLAYLLKVASGMYLPADRAMEYARQIMTGDINGLLQRFQTYRGSAVTFARLNQMMGGKHDIMNGDQMGSHMQRMKGLDSLQRTKEHVEGVMDSDVVKSRPVMAKALKNLSKRI